MTPELHDGPEGTLGAVPDLRPGIVVDPSPTDPGPGAVPGPVMHLDTGTGARPLGPPTVDSDADGRADTVVLTDGVLALATDLDGDADVDVLTVVDDHGRAHTWHDGPDGSGGTAGRPPAAPGTWDEGPAPPAPVLDPAGGHWIRRR